MKTPLIQTETQWGNNIIINVNLTIKGDGTIEHGFFEALKRKLTWAISTRKGASEYYDKYPLKVVYLKQGVPDGENVFR